VTVEVVIHRRFHNGSVFFYLIFRRPSSAYSYGGDTRIAIETARKKVAQLLGAKPEEILICIKQSGMGYPIYSKTR